MPDPHDGLFIEAERWIDGDWPAWAKRVRDEGYRRRLHGDSIHYRIVNRLAEAAEKGGEAAAQTDLSPEAVEMPRGAQMPRSGLLFQRKDTAMSGWRRIDKDTPKGVEVIVFDRKSDPPVFTASTCHEARDKWRPSAAGIDATEDDFFGDEPRYPTHWQHLPEPPERPLAPAVGTDMGQKPRGKPRT